MRNSLLLGSQILACHISLLSVKQNHGPFLIFCPYVFYSSAGPKRRLSVRGSARTFKTSVVL